MNHTRKVVLTLIGVALLTTLGVSPAVAGEEPTPPATAGVDFEDLPATTQARILELESQGVDIRSIVSEQYAEQPGPGEIGVLAYQTAPCYLTVILSSFGSSPSTVDQESLTGCTIGAANGTRHIMTIDKKDLFWGFVATVASGQRSNAYGGFISDLHYGCPTTNQSDFWAETQGRIMYNGQYYYATGYDGWDRYNCG